MKVYPIIHDKERLGKLYRSQHLPRTISTVHAASTSSNATPPKKAHTVAAPAPLPPPERVPMPAQPPQDEMQRRDFHNFARSLTQEYPWIQDLHKGCSIFTKTQAVGELMHLVMPIWNGVPHLMVKFMDGNPLGDPIALKDCSGPPRTRLRHVPSPSQPSPSVPNPPTKSAPKAPPTATKQTGTVDSSTKTAPDIPPSPSIPNPPAKSAPTKLSNPKDFSVSEQMLRICALEHEKGFLF